MHKNLTKIKILMMMLSCRVRLPLRLHFRWVKYPVCTPLESLWRWIVKRKDKKKHKAICTKEEQKTKQNNIDLKIHHPKHYCNLKIHYSLVLDYYGWYSNESSYHVQFLFTWSCGWCLLPRTNWKQLVCHHKQA